MRFVCGLARVPHRTTLNRFVHHLVLHCDLVTACLINIVEALRPERTMRRHWQMADLPNCPNCELARQLNPLVCYCGYDFHSGEMSPDHMVRMSFWQICWGQRSNRPDDLLCGGSLFQIVVVSRPADVLECLPLFVQSSRIIVRSRHCGHRRLRLKLPQSPSP